VEELAARRDLFQGFGNALGRAVELVVTPLIFAAVGLLLDHLLGWTPALTIFFGIWGLAGAFLRNYYAYARAMDEAEAGKPWARK
jgi:hypothetical protein